MTRMARRLIRLWCDRAGIAAVEFAMVVPVLCAALLGILDGWSYVTSSLSMRAGVKTAANMVMAGATNDSATQAAGLSSWQNAPADAQVTITRIYQCGTTVVTSTTICSNLKSPSVYVQIQASGTWTPPFIFGVFPTNTAISHQQVVRVR